MTWRVKTSLLFVLVVLLAALAVAATNHILKGTYIDSNVALTVIPADTLTPIGNVVTVACPGTGTCTIQADMLAENGGSSTAGNQFEVCLYVDGVEVDPYCFGYAGVTPSDGTYLLGSSSQSLSGVSPGNHTVQTYFWSSKGCNVVYRHSTYNVYKP